MIGGFITSRPGSLYHNQIEESIGLRCRKTFLRSDPYIFGLDQANLNVNRPLDDIDNGVRLKISFLVHRLNYMLWVLQRLVI